MILAVTLIEGASLFVGGAAMAAALLFLRERTLRAASLRKEKEIMENARREAENIVREARLSANEEALKLREQNEQLFASRLREIAGTEQKLHEREVLVNTQLEKLVQEEKNLLTRVEDLEKKRSEADGIKSELKAITERKKAELQNLSHLSEAEARTMLLQQVEQEAAKDAGHIAKRLIEDAKNRAEEKARRIISTAIQRYAGEHAYETSTATVALHGDEMKGRIIGREGRNIRAFESATGVTVLIDDTPNAVVLSGFDPVRREIAREAMERLILDGRIHPTRIEEVVAKVTQEIEEAIVRAGEDAVMRAGLPPVHIELVKILGRLKFRHSFSQNVLYHSVEVSHLTGMMAAELGADVNLAKRAGLFHDIGKAVGHEIEGPHALVGAEILKRYGEQDEVINGVAAHHDEAPHIGIYGILVSASDAISASRPGARSETMATYIKRVEDLERLGASFPGVEKCYAVHAGRELRVIVLPEALTDEESFTLARTIARKIEERLQYPGQIRVTVVRERRCVEYAK